YNLSVWGYSSTAEPIPDSVTVWEILDSMRAKNGYSASRTGPIARVLYAANGGSTDWEMKDTLHNGVTKFVTYAFCIETNQTDFWDGYNNYTVIQNNINQCRPVNIYFTKIAGVFFDNPQPIVADTTLGNRTGQLDPNETSHLWVRIRNRAIHPLDSAYNISAQLISLDTQVVVQTGNATFPNILRKATGDNRNSRFVVYCSRNAQPGSVKTLKLILTFKDDTCTITQSVSFNLTIGNNPVGIAEVEKDFEKTIKLYSNPASGSITFEFTRLPDKEASLIIYDATGRLVKKFEHLKSRLVWDGIDDTNAEVKSGIYFYILKGQNLSLKGKFVFIGR
ncbi:MAG: T9SS type A sorting domain-containing protein, partial [candidate division WOR-3 bacterium]|nr:T9SS type A sorting domain-containing protein [candidate division WOR-3 bacterium]